MVIKLGLDDADFGRGVANSKKQVSYLAKEMSANMKIADMAGNKLGKLGTRYDGLTKIIGAQENQVKDLKKAYEDSFVDGKATEQTKRLATQLQDANGKLANYKLQLQQTAGAVAEYKIKNEGFTGAVNKASDSLIKSGSALKDFGGKMSSVGSTMTKAVTLPIVAGFGYATKAASDFTTQIGEIGPLLTNGGEVTEEYRKQLDKMSESSKQWSKTYGVATSEINNGLAEVVRKGYDANQTMGVMPSILDATKASGEQFNDVMNVTTEVISQFNLKGKTYEETLKNATRVTDGLTYVANATSAGFVDLGSAMSFVGPVANSLGMSVEETASAIGLLSDAGIGGEKAGTALRGALTRLLKPSKQNIEGFDKLGISVNDFKDGSLTLPDILDKIKKNTNGWTDAQRTAAIALAFGTESQSAMNVLVGQGGKALRDLTKDTKGATGATKDIAKSMNDLPANKVARFKESLNVLAITLGEKLLPIVTPWVEKATDMVNSFSELDEATQKNIIKWGLMAAAAGPALKLLGGGASVVGGLATTTGKLGKSFVELSAEMAKKKAIEEATEAFALGNVSAGDLIGTLGGGVGTVGKFGGAAATASGSTGLGAMMSVLGPLTPAILGVVGVGGALAIGYGAWKLWGEEAYNSAKRTSDWGVDVGKATGDALYAVKDYSGQAIGQFNLMEQGLTVNTQAMSDNFAKMGESIETNMIKKIQALKELVDLMPEDVRKAAEKITEEEVSTQEKYLQTIQENNAKIAEIRENASKHNRELNYADTVRIKALSEESANAYVQSLGKSEAETKQILAAMTGNVADASKEQATEWLKNLGKQRQNSQLEYRQMRENLEEELVKGGYDLNSAHAKKMLGLLETSGQAATQLTEDQMASILGKYPELADEIFLANGQMIDSSSNASYSMIAENKKMMETMGNFSQETAKNAEKNKDSLKLVLDESDKFGSFWNGLVLDPKTGEVSTNAQDEVNKAAESEKGWNQLMWISKDANVNSDVKMMIAEAAIANGKWEQMSFTEQQALLDSNVAQTMTQTLQVKGYWDNLSLEERKAVITSNTPEMMAETIYNIGLWDELEPEVKELGADNQKFISTVAQSEEKMANWNNVPDTVKQFQGENYDLLTKIYESDENFKRWESIPDSEKIMLAENADLMEKVATSQEVYDAWTKMPTTEKMMLGNNKDLSDKVFESTEKMNAWIGLDSPIKALVADNQDLLAKVEDGTLSVDDFNENEAKLKILLGDATNVIKQATDGEKFLNNYQNNNPKNKLLTGDSSDVKEASLTGEALLNGYRNNNPLTKYLKGDSSNVRTNATTGVNALNKFDSTNPGMTYLRATDNASYNAGRATDAVKNFGRQGNKTVTLTSITKNITQWITEKFTRNATGTNYHPGGLAMVNDQRGTMYRELVQHPTGEMYIPQGRNVMLDLPRGSKVYTASQTKQMVPKYAEGVGIPKNSTLVRNLESVNSRNTTVIQNDNRELVSLMRQMLNTIARLKPAINVNAQGTIADMDLRNISQDLAFLTQIEKGGLNG